MKKYKNKNALLALTNVELLFLVIQNIKTRLQSNIVANLISTQRNGGSR
jgi:hypothetical protein